MRNLLLRKWDAFQGISLFSLMWWMLPCQCTCGNFQKHSIYSYFFFISLLDTLLELLSQTTALLIKNQSGYREWHLLKVIFTNLVKVYGNLFPGTATRQATFLEQCLHSVCIACICWFSVPGQLSTISISFDCNIKVFFRSRWMIIFHQTFLLITDSEDYVFNLQRRDMSTALLILNLFLSNVNRKKWYHESCWLENMCEWFICKIDRILCLISSTIVCTYTSIY